MNIQTEKIQGGVLSNKASHPSQCSNLHVSEDPDPTNCPGPDRGRAWLIVFASAWVAFVSLGLSRSSGVLFVAFVSNFNASREDASWPSSLFHSAFSLSSLLIAPLCNRVSLRLISSVGSIVAALGVGLSYFAQDIISLTLLFGLLQGEGAKETGLGAAVTAANHAEKGIWVLPVIAAKITHTPNSNIIVLPPDMLLFFFFSKGIGCALLLFPAILAVNLYFERHRTTANGIFLAGISIGAFVFPPAIQAILNSHGLKNTFLCMSTILFSSLLPVMLFVRPEWDQKAKQYKQNAASDCPKKDKLLSKARNVTLGVNVPSRENDLKPLKEMRVSEVSIFNEIYPLLENSDSYLVLQPHYVSFPQLSVSCENSNEIVHHERENMIALIWIVLSHPMLCLMLALDFIIGMCFPLYQQIIVDYSCEWGISATTASYVMSIMSIVELVGRLGTGWISDCRFVTRRTLISSVCAVGGLCFCLMPFINIVHVFVTLSVCVCFLEGILAPVQTAAKMEYFGQEKFIIAFALTLSINGCLSLLRPVLIGYFRDSVKSYDGLLISFGVVLSLTAFMWLFEPLLIRRLRSAEEKQNHFRVSYGSTR